MRTVVDLDEPLPSPTPGEALLAVTGLDDILARKFKRPTMDQMSRAERIPREIKRGLRRFVDESGFDKRERHPDPSFDYDFLLERLNEPMLPEHFQRAAASFGELQDLGIDYITAAQLAVPYLRSRMPVSSSKTLARAKNLPPSSMELADFRRVWTVATEPLSVLRNLNAGVLTADEIDALGAMFPTLANAIALQFGLEIAAKLTRSPNWEMPTRKERVAQILLKSDGDLDLATEMQTALASVRAQKQESQTPPPPNSQARDRMLSDAQRITER